MLLSCAENHKGTQVDIWDPIRSLIPLAVERLRCCEVGKKPFRQYASGSVFYPEIVESSHTFADDEDHGHWVHLQSTSSATQDGTHNRQF